MTARDGVRGLAGSTAARAQRARGCHGLPDPLSSLWVVRFASARSGQRRDEGTAQRTLDAEDRPEQYRDRKRGAIRPSPGSCPQIAPKRPVG